jgi:hypothetical protein
MLPSKAFAEDTNVLAFIYILGFEQFPKRKAK